MACNCKNTVTSFLGGDVANPTTFLNCGEADGTYNNPLETGKTQCIAENNVLRILDTYKISGTVKNSGQIVFERTFTGDTDSWEEWNNDGTYFRPIKQTDTKLSAQTLDTSGYINAAGSITTGTHDGSDILYVNRFNSTYAYGHIYGGRSDENDPVGLRFVTRNTGGIAQEAFTLLGDDRKATFQGNVVVSGNNTTLNTLSATNVYCKSVITASTVSAKYSGVTIANATDTTFAMTTATFRPGMVVEFDMGAGSGDIVVELPVLADWYYGKYTFLFTATPNAGSNFVINGAGSEKFYGMTMCLDGNEIINGADTITFGAGKTTSGTKVEIISTREDRMMMYITSNSNKADITPS
tara:strand:- start:1966 stop:3027 length:1062 start_codon:yes stop_codon:yes gene_type:complete